MYIKLAAQICSTCFSAFIGVQHVLQMAGYGHSMKSAHTDQPYQYHGTATAHPTLLQNDNAPVRDRVNMLEAPPPPYRERATPVTRILRAACFSEIMFSLTGAITTACLIHDPSLRDSFQLMFWAMAPHWCTQVSSFCWMGTLAIYIAMKNRAMFDIAIAHAIIWMLTMFYWVLELYAAYYSHVSYQHAAIIWWTVFATTSFVVVGTCWSIFVLRWRQQPTGRRGSFVVSKLLSYTLAFFVFVSPIVLVRIIEGVDAEAQDTVVMSIFMALWPTANAIIHLTKPFLFSRCFQDREVASDGLEGGEPSQAMPVNQLIMSPTQHELKGLEIGDKIGEGVAVVYKGKWRGAIVAVKMKSLSLGDEDLKEFQDACNFEIEQEAEVMKTLSHPNIVLFMEAGFYKKSICIISEYCARGSLRDVLMRSNIKHLSWSTKLRLALGIAHGIQYLHNANPPMIHRDLKSPNVLVDDSWHAKIADFGTLRLSEIVSTARNLTSRVGMKQPQAEPEPDPMVMTGVVGTTRWMAPEVIRGEKYYTSKVDIYSFGLILWELIEGQLPFESTRWNHEIEKLVLRGVRPPVQTDLCPIRWNMLLVTCWQADPKDRPTIQEVISSLQRIAREETLDTNEPRFTGMSSMYSMTQSTRSSTMFNMSAASLSSSAASSPSTTRTKRTREWLLDASYASVAESDEDRMTESPYEVTLDDDMNRESTAILGEPKSTTAFLLPSTVVSYNNNKQPSSRRPTRQANSSFVTLDLSSEDEDSDGIVSEFYIGSGDFRHNPIRKVADSPIDEVRTKPTPLITRDTSGLISI
jgi:serine/threonine-protein kinase TNNI3K